MWAWHGGEQGEHEYVGFHGRGFYKMVLVLGPLIDPVVGPEEKPGIVTDVQSEVV
jgi:hypothetical protein